MRFDDRAPGPIKNGRDRIRIHFQYLATLCDFCGKIGGITSPGMKHPRFSALHAKSKSCVIIAIARLLVGASLVPLVATSIPAEPLANGIQDNSFFIEEAYNQEPGVVQHILNVPVDFTNGSREIAPSFTQEWPVFTQTHQISYTIPYIFTEDDNGLADTRLNYRLQAFMENKYTPAFAPRFSLVLPTGDSDKGFGAGVMG